MSRSKSVGKSVRISSGAKSAANEENQQLCFKNYPNRQLGLFEGFSLSVTQFTQSTSLLSNKNVPKIIYYSLCWGLLMDQM